MRRRPRRSRGSELIRRLVRETKINIEDFIYPVFVVEGEKVKKEISSLPQNYHFSVDKLVEEVKELRELGIKYILVFGVTDNKDFYAKEAYNKNGIVQRAVRAVKNNFDDIYVITDVCMCQYTDHGHCGILTEDGYVDNDETLEYLEKIAISHADAGADMVAPSDMMDGRVGFIREALDKEGYCNLPIMSYSAKYASSYYGPFRDAAGSSHFSGDRKTYQMDPANGKEALIEAGLDRDEGADILMVKPGLPYLDVIRRLKDNYNLPIAVYNVSGEYTMLYNAVEQGVLSEDAIMETMISFKRAGADIIITYFAKKIAQMLKEDKNG